MSSLLKFKANAFSQNGEDGVIAQIMKQIGDKVDRICCEFGAWDGMHLSNTRNLILQGWSGILIEVDDAKFSKLVETYQNNTHVYCLHALVGTGENSLARLMQRQRIGEMKDRIDLLSIDVDGLDYEILQTLEVFAKVICIEVNAGHDPTTREILPKEVAQNNVGQPFQCFTDVAERKGYRLVCYTGNAFYVRNDVVDRFGFEPLSNEAAYAEFLENLSPQERRWLFLVNKGVVPPFHRFFNKRLSARSLNVDARTALLLEGRAKVQNLVRSMKHGSRAVG